MEKDLDEIIETRCDLALQKNSEYLELQSKLADAHGANDIDTFSELSFRMQLIVEKLCYKLAIKDMHEILEK